MSLKDALNSDVSLDGLKQLGSIQLGKDNRYPSKRSVNLVFDGENAAARNRRRIITILLLVFIVLFAKFMVIDVIANAVTTQQRYEATSAAIDRLAKSNRGYADLNKQYITYGDGALSAKEMAETDRVKMLGIINENVNPTSAVEGVQISGNTATITVDTSKLSNLSNVVASFQGNSSVASCTLSTASRVIYSPVTSVIVVRFKGDN